MKNILLVFTGGTIGSQIIDSTIDTDQQAGFKLLQLFASHDSAPESVKFKIIQPLQILSENLHPIHWQHLVKALELEMQQANYDGIILTHGTDTLAFSAAFLGLYFNYLHIPLLVVSSDLPLEHPKANGWPNFRCAVAFIRQIDISGVFVPYQNMGQPMCLYLGTQLASCLQLSSDFIGIQSKVLLYFDGENFTPAIKLHGSPRKIYHLKADFSSRILLIKPYPGLNYSYFNLDQVDVVLHDLYHSGTACTNHACPDSANLMDFMLQCQQRKIPVYLAPALSTENIYSSTKQLLDQGAQILWNISLEIAYVKLLLAYANFTEPSTIHQFMQENIANEFV
jgi:L-asparaginase